MDKKRKNEVYWRYCSLLESSTKSWGFAVSSWPCWHYLQPQCIPCKTFTFTYSLNHILLRLSLRSIRIAAHENLPIQCSRSPKKLKEEFTCSSKSVKGEAKNTTRNKYEVNPWFTNSQKPWSTMQCTDARVPAGRPSACPREL